MCYYECIYHTVFEVAAVPVTYLAIAGNWYAPRGGGTDYKSDLYELIRF
jgi:hypothetical protein